MILHGKFTGENQPLQRQTSKELHPVLNLILGQRDGPKEFLKSFPALCLSVALITYQSSFNVLY